MELKCQMGTRIFNIYRDLIAGCQVTHSVAQVWSDSGPQIHAPILAADHKPLYSRVPHQRTAIEETK